MNYRHEFHAGNFADVFKHATLTRILLYLQRKPAPYRVIDTHAGSGRYDLSDSAAGRTQEWRNGIGRLDLAAFGPRARALIEPFANLAVRDKPSYPGSPAIALAMARPFDRMIFCELQPSALGALRACVGRDRRAKVVAIDGYTGLKAYIPPVERRGLVLIDPPFEADDEFERLTAAILAAHAKWRGGMIMAWYPIKDRRGVEGMAATLSAAAIPDVLRLELHVGPRADNGPLSGCGLFVVNPPFTLEEEMGCLLPELAQQLGEGRGEARVDRLSISG